MIVKALFRQKRYAAAIVLVLISLASGVFLAIVGSQSYMFEGVSTIVNATSPQVSIRLYYDPVSYRLELPSSVSYYSGGGVVVTSSSSSSVAGPSTLYLNYTVLAGLLGVGAEKGPVQASVAVAKRLDSMFYSTFSRQLELLNTTIISGEANLTVFYAGSLVIGVSNPIVGYASTRVSNPDLIAAQAPFIYPESTRPPIGGGEFGYPQVYTSLDEYYYHYLTNYVRSGSISAYVVKSLTKIERNGGTYYIATLLVGHVIVNFTKLKIVFYDSPSDLELIGYRVPRVSIAAGSDCIPAILSPKLAAYYNVSGQPIPSKLYVDGAKLCIVGIASRTPYQLGMSSYYVSRIQLSRHSALLFVPSKYEGAFLKAVDAWEPPTSGADAERLVIAYSILYNLPGGLVFNLTNTSMAGEKWISQLLLNISSQLEPGRTVVPNPTVLVLLAKSSPAWKSFIEENLTRMYESLDHIALKAASPEEIMDRLEMYSSTLVEVVNAYTIDPGKLLELGPKEFYAEYESLANAYYTAISDYNESLIGLVKKLNETYASQVAGSVNNECTGCKHYTIAVGSSTYTVMPRGSLQTREDPGCILNCGVRWPALGLAVYSRSTLSIVYDSVYRGASNTSGLLFLGLITLVLLVLLATGSIARESLSILVLSARRWLAVIASRGGDLRRASNTLMTVILAIAVAATGVGILLTLLLYRASTGAALESIVSSSIANWKIDAATLAIILVFVFLASKGRINEMRSVSPEEAYRPLLSLQRSTSRRRARLASLLFVFALFPIVFAALNTTPDELMNKLQSTAGPLGSVIGVIFIMVSFIFFPFAPAILLYKIGQYLSATGNPLYKLVARIIEGVQRSSVSRLGASSSKRIGVLLQSPLGAGVLGLSSLLGLLMAASGVARAYGLGTQSFKLLLVNGFLNINDVAGIPGMTTVFRLAAPLLGLAFAAIYTSAILRVFDSIRREIVVMRARGASIGDTLRFVYSSFLPVILTTIVAGFAAAAALVVGMDAAFRIVFIMNVYDITLLKAVSIPHVLPILDAPSAAATAIVIAYMLLLPAILTYVSVHVGNLASKLRETL